MTVSPLRNHQKVNCKKALLKLRCKALALRTDDKLRVWLMTVEERWTEEIVACLQGKFPDWRE